VRTTGILLAGLPTSRFMLMRSDIPVGFLDGSLQADDARDCYLTE
jgi:hypothetical protein